MLNKKYTSWIINVLKKNNFETEGIPNIQHGFPTKYRANKAKDRINRMMGLPMREGFHIVRVYYKNGFWYLSRYYE